MSAENRVFARHVAESAIHLKGMHQLSPEDMKNVAGGSPEPSPGTNIFTYRCDGCTGGDYDEFDV